MNTARLRPCCERRAKSGAEEAGGGKQFTTNIPRRGTVAQRHCRCGSKETSIQLYSAPTMAKIRNFLLHGIKTRLMLIRKKHLFCVSA